MARFEGLVINYDEVLTWKICLPICMCPNISTNVKIWYGVLPLNVIEQFRFATTLMHKNPTLHNYKKSVSRLKHKLLITFR
jgi:hypothetical protein